MCDANLPHFQRESIRKVVEQNFKLDMADTEAWTYIQRVIFKSLKMVVPQICEKIHSIAQSLKK